MTQTNTGALQRVCALNGCTQVFSVLFPSVRQRFYATKSHGTRPGRANPNWRGGKTKHELYETYLDMIGRCHRVTHHAYARYGGRGIVVCERWQENFWVFAADMGPRPMDHSLDRRDNDGPYSPGNCRWATATEQVLNRRPTTRRPDRDQTTGRFVADR